MAGDPAFRQPLGGRSVRFIQGSTGLERPTTTIGTTRSTQMARLEGTGKDPLGRYGKGEIFDVPQYVGTTTDALSEGIEPQENPTYTEIVEKGWAKPVAPEDDPGRTVTQIADAMTVDPNATLAHPADAAVAEKIGSEQDALAIVHTGDPKAKAEGDLKPEAVKESQRDDRLQRDPSPRFLGDNTPVAAQQAAAAGGDGVNEGSSSSSRRSGGSGGSSS